MVDIIGYLPKKLSFSYFSQQKYNFVQSLGTNILRESGFPPTPGANCECSIQFFVVISLGETGDRVVVTDKREKRSQLGSFWEIKGELREEMPSAFLLACLLTLLFENVMFGAEAAILVS